jgi:UDP-N-acetylmuramate: L-alanyl-gamma-D-glutamyl-meso-diaminopimelate ligase
VSFEPRSNTARTSLFQEAFTVALSAADRVYLGAVHRADSMAAHERLDTARMVAALSDGGRVAMAFEDNDALFEQIQTDRSAAKGCVFVFFTNGAFDGVPLRTAELFGGPQ